MARRFLAAGVLCLVIAAAAYAALRLTRGPEPILIHVRWAPGVAEPARREAERRYHLSEAEFFEGRTWGYTLNDLSATNIKALVTDPVVEDTQDIDRRLFRSSPAAETRPHPSNSPVAVGLWGATILFLSVGLLAVSLGLIERVAAGIPTPPFASVHGANPPWPAMSQAAPLVVIVVLMVACFLAARTMELRGDEDNHLEQIQRYLAGDYSTTTTTIGGFHAAAALFASLVGRSSKEVIRIFALLLSAATILVFWSLMRLFEPQATAMRTLQFVLFPLLFPFWFLIYTDVLALLLLLLAVAALARRRFHITGVLMLLSVAVRQTYAVWLALLGAWAAVIDFAGSLRQVVRRTLSFGVAAALFALFIVANNGIAIGDQASHPAMEFQTENLLFMLVCFFLMFVPLILSKLPQMARLHPALLVGVPLVSAALFFGTFRVDHPYNGRLEDVFLRNELLAVMTSSTLARAATSIVIALATLSLFVIRLRHPLYYLVYPFAALAMLPAWLIEQRYYLPAFTLFMLFRESASPAVERTMVAMNGILALYLFTGVMQGWFFL